MSIESIEPVNTTASTQGIARLRAVPNGQPAADTTTDTHAPGITPDGKLTAAGKQAVAELVDQLIAEANDPDTAATNVIDGLPKYLPASLARVYGQHDPAPGHYPFCQPGACISQQDEHGETWHEHNGAAYHTVISSDEENAGIRLVAQLGHSDGFAHPAPTVHLYEEEGGGIFLDASGVDKAIANLEGLAQLLRVLRGQMTAARAEVAA